MAGRTEWATLQRSNCGVDCAHRSACFRAARPGFIGPKARRLIQTLEFREKNDVMLIRQHRQVHLGGVREQISCRIFKYLDLGGILTRTGWFVDWTTTGGRPYEYG